MPPAAPDAAFLTARWADLVMLNYGVDPALLASRVPAGTRLDTFEGRTLASLVGFRFLDTRLCGVPVPWHRDFEELNLRFYVVRDAPEGPRRGVVFVKEMVPRAAIAWLARRVYNENYVARRMRHVVEEPDGSGDRRVVYAWRDGGRWGRMGARVAGPAHPARNGSEEQFISEHYWGYVVQRGGATLEYRVDHPPWNVWCASDVELEADLTDLYGPELAAQLGGEPTSAFVADGSRVTVRRGAPLPPSARVSGRSGQVLDALSPDDRLRLVRLLCSFAWADARMHPEERDLVYGFARRLALAPEALRQVDTWLVVPPDVNAREIESIDAAQHVALVEAATSMILVDGEISHAEREMFQRFLARQS